MPAPAPFAASGPHPVPEISVACPCYNEEENVQPIAAAIIAELEAAGASFEFIFIDNASTDHTVPLIKEMCARDPRIKLIANARNFGQMRSPTHVIYQGRGRAILAISSDFQDPPELIGPLLAKWRQGWPIVLGVREREPSSVWLWAARKLAYGFFARFGDVRTISGATGFGIYGQEVVQMLKRWNEPEPFFRAMLVESGFPIATILHKRGRRERGRSSNTLWPLVDFMISGVSGSAKKLVRLPIFLGLGAFALAGLMLPAAVVLAAFGRGFAPFLWGALAEVQVGTVLVFLGLVGDQVRLVTERTRGVPLVIERERVGFDADDR